MHENDIATHVIEAATQLHKELGPGLLENVYKECLYFKLGELGLIVEKEKPLPVVYNNIKLSCGYRIDLLIQNKVLVEVKSVEALNDIFVAQTLTYLRLANLKLGLLINFNSLLLKYGIRRVINGKL